ncbi:TPA: UDP-glucose/GDP-mannose dehydrogenase family protein [Candidatus Micrarchaeota archaeon]|nr:UDP-glucose/GDP-mannose dehydrogenase family protein [Candidatus Micrarchaeota archaeon]
MTTPVRRRPMIHNLLEDLQPGRWIDLDELNRVMQSNSLYSFDMVNYSWKLYLLDQHYGHLDYHDTWPLLQFRYLLVYLLEYCATLGLVDVAYRDPGGARSDYHECWGTDDLTFLSHCDGLQYIRVNDLGAFVLGYTDSYEVKNDNSEVLEFEGTDLLLIKGTSLPPGQTLYLEKIGERKNGDRWSLSITSLLGAMKGGESLAEIRKMLESISSAGFSTEMEQLFQDVEQRSTAFVDVGKATLIKCDTEFRKQVLTHKKLSGLCLPAGENYLAVLPGKEKLFAKIDAYFDGSLQGKTMAVWGLAFKPNTDDMREAPSRVLMERLWQSGASVRAYDPVAMAETQRIYGQRDDLVLCDSAESALEGADALVVVTEWSVFRSPDFDVIKASLSHPAIFDGRNIYEPEQMRGLGIDYFGIGRGQPSSKPT